MKKTLLVMKNEIINTVLRPSFILITFGLPILGFVLFTVFSNVGADQQQSLMNLVAPSVDFNTQGYVDHSDLIQTFPSDLETLGVEMIAYPDEDAAQAALEAGEIPYYYIIPADIVETGEYTVVTSDFSPLSGDSNQWLMDWTLTLNMVGGDEELAAKVEYPMVETRISKTGEVASEEFDSLAFFVPYGVTIFFYMVIFGSASLMLNSIGKEKQNRAMEVLLLSVSPRQLLTGKIIGLGLVGVMQTVIYTTVGYTLLKISGRSFEAASQLNLPPTLIIWGVVFFVFGFIIYAALMAGAGALAPNTREASQITFILIIPMIIPLFFISSLIEDSNSLLSTAISFFPFSAPVAMMTRMTAGTVPVWQVALSVALMAATGYLIIVLVARLFRAQNLLSGQELNPKVYFKALIGK
ncbi:MAG: ABC transporter permease [Anaerolineales bacterium]